MKCSDLTPAFALLARAGFFYWGKLKMSILNCTQHTATREQLAAGVVDLNGVDRELLLKLITFESLPNDTQLADRSADFADFVEARIFDFQCALIAPAPFWAFHVEAELRARNIPFVYAFSRRESVEEKQVDGSVVKRSVFKHAGFIGRVPKRSARESAVRAEVLKLMGGGQLVGDRWTPDPESGIIEPVPAEVWTAAEKAVDARRMSHSRAVELHGEWRGRHVPTWRG